MYSNPGTQVGAQDKDFSAVSQTDLIRRLLPSVAQIRIFQVSQFAVWLQIKVAHCLNIDKGPLYL